MPVSIYHSLCFHFHKPVCHRFLCAFFPLPCCDSRQSACPRRKKFQPGTLIALLECAFWSNPFALGERERGKIAKCPVLRVAKVMRRWRGDKRHLNEAGSKSGGRKNLPLPSDLFSYRTSLSFFAVRRNEYFQHSNCHIVSWSDGREYGCVGVLGCKRKWAHQMTQKR